MFYGKCRRCFGLGNSFRILKFKLKNNCFLDLNGAAAKEIRNIGVG